MHVVWIVLRDQVCHDGAVHECFEQALSATDARASSCVLEKDF